MPVVKPDVKKEVKADKKEEPKKKEGDKKEEPKKRSEAKKVKKIKKDKKEKKLKKSKKKKKVQVKKTKNKPSKEDSKEQNTTPPCTPPPDARLAQPTLGKIVDVPPAGKNPSPLINLINPSPVAKQADPPLVDYDDDDEDEDDIENMEITESFPLSKELFTKEDSPNTEEYIDNWENEEERTPVVPVGEEDSFKDGFSTPLFVNPSPPADHKFDDQGSTQEIVNGSSTPPIFGTIRKREDSAEDETRIFKPSKQLFGIDDIYSDVLNRINPSQAKKKPLTPPSSPSDEEVEERTTTPPLESASLKSEPENPYANFSEEDLAKIQKLDENLAKIQSMRSSYGDPADEFCEGLNKMEKFLTTARNITIQKYSSTPQFLVTLQEADLKDDQSPPVFQSSIKMVITPTKISKNRIQSGTNLLGSDDEDDIVETEKLEVKKEEEKKVVEEKEKVVVKEEKKTVVEVKKERKSTRSPEKKDKDRKSFKGKPESPNRKRRSRSPPKSLDKGHRRDRHVIGESIVFRDISVKETSLSVRLFCLYADSILR